jgi:hypothetical protein
MRELVIQPKDDKKGRSFQATCLAIITANGLFPEANGKTIRPVWAMFAGSEAELRPFMANLRLGRKAEPPIPDYRKQGDGERVEFLKTVGYYLAWQRETEGSIATIYHPDLFRLDPGMVNPTGLSFVMLVPSDWEDTQEVDRETAVDYVADFQYPITRGNLYELVPTAYLFAAYIDRRTRCPLIADGRFYLQLLCAALHAGHASFPGTNVQYVYTSRHDWGHNSKQGFNIAVGGHKANNAEGIEALNLRHAISFLAKHTEFEEFLAEQVAIYFSRTEGEFRSISKVVDLSCLK